MARALRIQFPDAYYHVTCRGNQRQAIFVDAHDEKTFLKILARSLEIYNVSLLAYVCMPNHFHLLVTTPEANLSDFMRHFNITYTSFFNRKHKRVGHLYQGRYKAFLIDADNYLLEVSRYIHLNPVRGENFSDKAFQEKWNTLLKERKSSLPGYFSVRKRMDFVHYDFILDYMGGDNQQGRRKYRRFIHRGFEQDLDNPLELGKGSGIVGEDQFVKWVKEKFIKKETPRRELPALRVLSRRFEPEELVQHFVTINGKTAEDICQRGKQSLERVLLMELLYRFCHLTQSEIGRLIGGIDYSAVSQARKRLQIRMKQKPKLKRDFDKLSNQLLKLSRVKI
ncbi:MAG: transposase [Desulfobacterales bacterium]|jgi:REP element-mobilizing transposase RayT